MALDFEFLKYLGGGFVSFLVDLVLIEVFLHIGWSKEAAIVFGFVVSTMVFSYFFHKIVTFQAGSRKKTYRRYFVASVILFTLDIGGSIFISDLLLGDYGNALLRTYMVVPDRDILILFAKVIAAGVAGLSNFLFLKNWVFREKQETQPD